MKLMILIMLVLFTCSVRASAQPPPIASVPINFKGPMPVVEVTLNGQGPFHFTIDTGAALQLDIDPALAAKLKLEVNGSVRGGDPSGRNAQEFDTVSVDSLQLGNVEFRNVTAVSRPRRTGPRPEAEGILGFKLFVDYLLTLDYPGQQLKLSRGELPRVDGSMILNLENPHIIPVVELSIGNSKMRAHLDSGNMVGGFILPIALIDKLKLATEPVTVGRARTVSSEVEIKEARLNDNIKLGAFEFKQPLITFPSIADEVNIGLKVLREFSITFDQKNQRVKFERNSVPFAELPTTSSLERPDIRGTITKIQRAEGEDKRIIGTVLVEAADKGANETDTKVDKANLIITNATNIRTKQGDQQVEATFEQLKVGDEIEARFVEGPTVMIYPLRVAASVILIVKTSDAKDR